MLTHFTFDVDLMIEIECVDKYHRLKYHYEIYTFYFCDIMVWKSSLKPDS